MSAVQQISWSSSELQQISWPSSELQQISWPSSELQLPIFARVRIIRQNYSKIVETTQSSIAVGNHIYGADAHLLNTFWNDNNCDLSVWMFEEGLIKISVDVLIQNSSSNYVGEYQTCETFIIFKHWDCSKYLVLLYMNYNAGFPSYSPFVDFLL